MEAFKEGSQESGEPNPKKRKANQDEFLYEGHCEEHFSPNHFKCIKCNKYICGTCVVLIHNECPKPLPVLEAFNFMKGEKLKMIKVFKTKLEKESQMLDSKLDHLNRKQEKFYQEIKKAEEEIRNVKAEVKETKSKKEINKKRHEDSTCHEDTLEKATCNEDYEKADAKVNFFFEENNIDNLLPSIILSKEDAMKLTLKHLQENTFYVTKTDSEAMKYSKVKVEDDQISFGEWEEVAEGGSSCVDFFDFINSRTAVIDTHKFIEEFRSLLKTLGCSSVVPTEAFIKVLPQISSGGEFVIATDGGSPRAINFLLLALGIMNDSYQGTQLVNFNDSFVGGGFNNEEKLFPDVVEGIQDGGIYERNKAIRGDVEGWDANYPKELSYFRVFKKDVSYPSTSTFGRVKGGMEVVDHIKRFDIIIECGLIFDLS